MPRFIRKRHGPIKKLYQNKKILLFVKLFYLKFNLKSFERISKKEFFQTILMKVLYFSLAQRKVPKETWPFCTLGSKEAFISKQSKLIHLSNPLRHPEASG